MESFQPATQPEKDSGKDESSSNNKKSKYETLISQKDPKILERWSKEQDELKSKLILEDKFLFSLEEKSDSLNFIGGVDISGSKIHPEFAISALVICDKNMSPVYEKYDLVKMDQPYIPGFLAFREVNHLVKLVNELKSQAPHFLPQVLLVDGNGIFHVKGFGLASHLGVLIDIPTIGCGKTVFSVDGINKKIVKDIAKNFLKKGGDSYPLKGKSGRVWGYALKPTDDCENPLIISCGHKISNESSLKVVKKCILYRVPQPIRLSDKVGRKLIGVFERFIENHPGQEGNFNTDRYVKEHYDKLHMDLD